MPEKHKRQRGGLTKMGPVDYTDLREREAPTGKFRLIVNMSATGFSKIGDYTDFEEAKRQADRITTFAAMTGKECVGYVHSDSNRVLYTSE